MIQEVERRNAELQAARFAHGNRLLQREIAVEVSRATQIPEVGRAIHSLRTNAEAIAVHVLMLVQVCCRITTRAAIRNTQRGLQHDVRRAEDRGAVDAARLRLVFKKLRF